MTGRAKWDAWSAAEKTYNGRGENAEKRYLEIARNLGWVPDAQPTSKPPLDVGRSSIDAGGIWDDDDSGSTGGGSGMGPTVSIVQRPDDGDEHDPDSIHGLAVSNNAIGLLTHLQENPKTDINERDEFVCG